MRLGLRLPSEDEKLSQLLKEIEKREADPKTANISGRWVTPNGAECELIDDGTDSIRFRAVKLCEGVLSCVGAWTRDGAKLTGKFHVVLGGYPESEGTVPATIRDAKTLVVFWSKIYPERPPAKGRWTWSGRGEVFWTKQQSRSDESLTPDDTGEPGRPPASRRAPGHARTQNDRDPFGPRPSERL